MAYLEARLDGTDGRVGLHGTYIDQVMKGMRARLRPSGEGRQARGGNQTEQALKQAPDTLTQS